MPALSLPDAPLATNRIMDACGSVGTLTEEEWGLGKVRRFHHVVFRWMWGGKLLVFHIAFTYGLNVR